MRVELRINGSLDPLARYFGWSPVLCELKVIDPEGATQDVDVDITNDAHGGGGRLVFYGARNAPASPQLSLHLPINGTPATFYCGGEFKHASVADRDTAIVVSDSGTELERVDVMVRVRKNADTLDDGERDRFLAALIKLNQASLGTYLEIRNMHRSQGSYFQAHGDRGFLPWHRIYLLDLERALQAHDASVALPYWRFDEASTRVFHQDFMGATFEGSPAAFGSSNPLDNWNLDGGAIDREIMPGGADPSAGLSHLLSNDDVIELAPDYALFCRPVERNPHDGAHVNFSGSLDNPSTAPRDPLFFLLHCNVDRLWAQWQWRRNLFSGAASFRNGVGVGHRLNDTLWPWNQLQGGGRPDETPPGGNLDPSLTAVGPGTTPMVGDAIDYQGRHNAKSHAGFDYDDVPFEWSTP